MKFMNITLIEKALRLAARAHRGQTRKDSDLPYITHPAAAALILARHGFPEVVVAAALVHDILEDTAVTPEELENELGPEVFKVVEAVSADNEKTVPWEERKLRYLKQVRSGSNAVRAVSLADKLHNLECMLIGYPQEGKNFWKHFSRGKEKQVWFAEELLKVFKETFDHPLVWEYEKLVRELKQLN